MKKPRYFDLVLGEIVGGGQTIAELPDGKRVFVWGGLPGEKVRIRITKSKSKMAEAVVEEVIEASPERVQPLDPESYLSTSPWQIMKFDFEQVQKSNLISEAFDMHGVTLPSKPEVYSDNETSKYRNKVEFSWFGDTRSGVHTLDLAFFKRGSKGKIPVDRFSLIPNNMMDLALAVRNLLQSKKIEAYSLKTLLIRADQKGNCVWQLYLKDKLDNVITENEAKNLPAQGGEIIYSDPKSPASRITKRLDSFGNIVLEDDILGVSFRYATESFFQVNIPVYEQALKDISKFVDKNKSLIDMYSGVGTIGLSVGSNKVTLVEVNQDAVREMRNNIKLLNREGTAKAVLAPSEKALEYIDGESTVVVDPPRAGLHKGVIEKLLETKPKRIIYLSCNPVTQARDVSLLLEKYKINYHRGYNFFPRTPHIENLVVLDLKQA